jgi:YD repeat-containing protein
MRTEPGEMLQSDRASALNFLGFLPSKSVEAGEYPSPFFRPFAGESLMVAIFTGLGSGYERGSGATLGTMGLLGGASLGRSGEQVFLNAATGNLLINKSDEFLIGRGLDVSISRTYNSLGDLSDDNGDNWRQSTDRRVYGLTGTVNAVGSTIKRVSADGSEITYSWDNVNLTYVATGGAGAYDRVFFNSLSNTWIWTDGDSRVTETYASFGTTNATPSWRLTQASDTDGNTLTFGYTGANLTRVTTANGDYVEYGWSGSNITQIVTYASGSSPTLTRTRYAYDSSNRLEKVTVDISPNDGSIIDNKTYVTTYTYDGSSKRVASISQTDGSRVEFTHTLIGSGYRVTAIKQSVDAVTSRTMTIGYDLAASITTLTDPSGAQTLLSYDANGQLVQVQQAAPTSDAGQPIVKFEYNGSGDVLSVRRYKDVAQLNAGNAAAEQSYIYDANGNATTVTDSQGFFTKRAYGARNELLSETRSITSGGLTATTRYVYDAENHLRYAISSEGRVTEYRYTATGMLDQRIEYPEHVYNVAPAGGGNDIIASTSFEAPDLGNGYQYSPTVPGMTFSAMAGITSNNTAWGFAAAPDGDQVAFIQSYGWGAGQITQQLSGLTSGTVYTLKFRLALRPATGGTRIWVTISGNTLGSVMPLSTSFTEYSMSFTATGSTAVLVFDGSATGAQDMATAIDDVRVYGPPAAPPSEADLDAWRNGLADRSSTKITVNSYDARDNLVSTTSYGAATAAGDPSSAEGFTRATYAYNQAGQLLSRFADGQASETFIYDGLGRVTSSLDLNGGTTSIRFNDAASTTVVTLANGFITTSTYNRMGELINVLDSGHIAAPPSPLMTVSTNSFESPEVGSQDSQNAFSPGLRFLGWSGIAGNGSSWNFPAAPDGDQVAYVRAAPGTGGQMEYDLAGLEAGVQYSVKFYIAKSATSGGTSISLSFNGNGGGFVSMGSFTPGPAGFQEVTATFTATQASGFLRFSAEGASGGVTAIDKVSVVNLSGGGETYKYDSRGLLRVAIDATGSKRYFIYDKLGRKVGEVNHLGDLIEYVYDSLGRLTATARYGNRLTEPQLAALDNVQTAVVLASLRPAAAATDMWTWQVYDKEGRLIEAIEGDGSVTLFQYDGAGRPVSSTAYFERLTAAQLQAFRTTPPTTPLLPPFNTAKDRSTRSFYDKDGLLIGMLDDEGFFSRIVYDKAGQKVEEISYLAVNTAPDKWTGTFDQVLAGQSLSAGDRRARYVYDGQGQLRYTIDALDQLVEFNYNTAGQLTHSIAYAGSIASTTDATYDNVKALVAQSGLASNPATRRGWAVYDSTGRAAYSVDAEGGVTRFFYDNVGQIVKTIQYAVARPTVAPPTLATMDSWVAGQASNAANRATRYYHTTAGQLRFSVDAEGFVSGNEYDAEGRVTRAVRWATPITASDSDTLSTIAARVGGALIDSQMVYDPTGRVLETIDGEGVRTRFEYNANGTLRSQTAAYGRLDASTTAFTYDLTGRVIEEYIAHGTPEQAVIRYEYDGLGNLVKVTDPNGNVTTRTYDTLGRMISETDAENGVVRFEYNAFSEVVRATDARNNSTYHYYDRLGRLTVVRDAENFVTEMTYSVFDDLTSSTRRANRTTSAVSVLTAPTAAASAQDAITRFHYDRLGRLLVTRDAENYLTETAYSVFGEVTSVTRRANRTTSPVDPATPPTAAANALDAVTRFEYDRLSRVVKAIDAEGHYEQYGLDAFGRRTSVRNKLGGTTTYAYDNRGLLLSETLPIASVRGEDGAVLATSVTNKFEYDGRGNQTKRIEAFGLIEARTTTLVYDKADRLTETRGDAVTVLSQANHVTESQVTPTQHIKYDAAGNVIETVDVLGARTLFYYDRLNRQIAQIDAAGLLTTYSYDASGNGEVVRAYNVPVAQPANAGGPPPSAPAGECRETRYGYDNLDRLLTSSLTGVRSGTWNGTAYVISISDLVTSFEYDANGNALKATDANGGAVYNYYDRLGRSVAAVDQENYLTTWTRDSEGNVLTERRAAQRAAGTPTTAAAPSVPENGADRVTTFTYDKNGRRLTETRAGLAASIVNANTGAITTYPALAATISYLYNGLGQVVRKTEATGDVITYGYDAGGRLVTETHQAYADQNAQQVQPTVDYSYNGLDLLTRTRQGGPSAAAGDRITRNDYVRGRLASMTDATGAKYTYAYDAAGNLVLESFDRQKSNDATVKNAILYSRDIFGRTTSRVAANWGGAAWSRGDSQDTGYSIFGEVSQRGTNGLWQEKFAYDKAGRLWRTNSGDGVWRFFIQDRNGNQTLAIESEGTDLVDKTIDQVVAIATRNGANGIGGAHVDGINVSISLFDKRGMAVETRLPQRQLNETGAPVNLAVKRGLNAFGEVAYEEDARGAQTLYEYNSIGRATKITRPSVSITRENGTRENVRPEESYFYDVSGRLVGTRDANGTLSSRALLAGTGYGGTEALSVAEFHPDGGVIRSSYDQFGDLRISVNEVGRITRMSYDARGRLIQVTQPSGLIEYFAYDLLGQRIKHWNSQLSAANVEKTDYDLQGRIVSQVAFGGDVTTTTYEWSPTLATGGMGIFGGWTQTATYANGRSMTLRSDVFGRDIYKSDLGGHQFNFTYDLAGRLAQRSGGETITYSYLNSGFVGSITTLRGTLDSAYDRSRASYGYDANGNKISESLERDGARWSFGWSPPNPAGPEDEQAESVGGGGKEEEDPKAKPGPVRLPPGGWGQLDSYSMVLQNATAAYDALGRMISWTEAGNATTPAAVIAYEYDANGNVRRTRADYIGLNAQGGLGSAAVKDHWYRFDAMNRVVVSKGILLDGQIVRGSEGVDIAYDSSGQRAFTTRTVQRVAILFDIDKQHSYEVPYSADVRESYEYDLGGYLGAVRVSESNYYENGDGTITVTPPSGLGALKASFVHDTMGRLTRQIDWLANGSETGFERNVSYNDKGQIWRDVTFTKQQRTDGGSDIVRAVTENKFYAFNPQNPNAPVDPATYALGAIVYTATESFRNGGPTENWTETKNSYVWWDGAMLDHVIHTPDVWDRDLGLPGARDFHSQYSYNDWGLLSSVSINDGRPRTVTFTNDLAGQAIRRDEADAGSGGDPHEIWYRFNGRQMGMVGNNGTLDIDYQASIAARVRTPGNGAFRLGDGNPTNYADFDQNYAPINSYSQGGAGGTYTVRSGDTLSSIAAVLWGDSSLWYKIAEANGMSGESGLIEGQTLTIPTGVLKNQHNASTFKPYDPAAAFGDISPTTPSPPATAAKNNRCGIFGQILLTVIAVAVSLILPVAAPAVFGGYLGGIGAAVVGSVVSQAVGVATGIQDKFDWKGVAMAALSAGVGGGLGKIPILKGTGNAFGDFAKNVVRGALGSAVTQGIGVATGLQGKFSWAAVASAGISAGVTGAVSRELGVKPFIDSKGVRADGSFGNFARAGMAMSAGAIAGAATQSLIDGSDFGDNLTRGLIGVIAGTAGNILSFRLAGAPPEAGHKGDTIINGTEGKAVPGGSRVSSLDWSHGGIGDDGGFSMMKALFQEGDDAPKGVRACAATEPGCTPWDRLGTGENATRLEREARAWAIKRLQELEYPTTDSNIGTLLCTKYSGVKCGPLDLGPPPKIYYPAATLKDVQNAGLIDKPDLDPCHQPPLADGTQYPKPVPCPGPAVEPLPSACEVNINSLSCRTQLFFGGVISGNWMDELDESDRGVLSNSNPARAGKLLNNVIPYWGPAMSVTHAGYSFIKNKDSNSLGYLFIETGLAVFPYTKAGKALEKEVGQATLSGTELAVRTQFEAISQSGPRRTGFGPDGPPQSYPNGLYVLATAQQADAINRGILHFRTTPAATWWKNTGQHLGTASPQVLDVVLDPNNFILEIVAPQKLGGTGAPPRR